MTSCNCPRTDGYVIIRQSCPHHEPARERRTASSAAAAEPTRLSRDTEDLACAWADYRKDYGPTDLRTAHKAFLAGWDAARGVADTGGALR